VGFVLGAMGGMLHSLLDVTIVYDGVTPSLWGLCCGRVSRIVIHVNERKIEDWLTEGDYATDEVFRDRLQQRLAGVWAEKDELITSILQESSD
jgi:hypothetical protein